MRLFFYVLSVALGVAPLSGCATMRNEVISGFCGARPQDNPRWARIEPPANADAYRNLARASTDSAANLRGEEYWFSLNSGQIKYCISPLRRSSTVPERNGSACDDRIAVWWVFRQNASGLSTNGAEYRICVL